MLRYGIGMYEVCWGYVRGILRISGGYVGVMLEYVGVILGVY